MEINEEYIENASDAQIAEALNTLESQTIENPPDGHGDSTGTQNVASTDDGNPDTAQQNSQSNDIKNTDFEWDEKKYKDKTVDELLDEIKAKDKKIFHEKKLIDRQAKEVGENRQKIADLANSKNFLENKIAELKKKEASLVDDDDIRTNIKQQALVEKELETVSNEQRSIMFYSQITSSYPDADILVSKVVPDIVRDDLTKKRMSALDIEKAVSWFTSGQWKTATGSDANIVMNILEKAKYEKVLRDKDAEISALKTPKADATTKNITKNISAVARQTSVPAGISAMKDAEYTEQQLNEMSDDEFNLLGKKLGQLK